MASEIGSNSIKFQRRIRRTIYDPRKDSVIPQTTPCSSCGARVRKVIPIVSLFKFPPGDPRIAANQGKEFIKDTEYWCRDCIVGAPIENDKGMTNVSVSD